MALISTDSFDYYNDITQKYAAASTAIISAGAGRNSSSGAVTFYGTTYFLEELKLFGETVESLTLFKGIAFRLGALPPSGRATILQFMESDFTPHIAITVDSIGIIEAYLGTQAGALLASAIDPVEVGTYYYIEVQGFIDDVAGRVVIKLWLDSTTVTTIIDFTGDTQNGGTGLLSVVGYGADGNTLTDAVPPTASWDDFYTCDDTGSAFNDFQGNKHLRAYFPNGAGFYTNWVPVPGIPNYGNVDENPPDGDTSYNFAPDTDPSSAPTFVSVSSSTLSPTVSAPAGITEGDLMVLIIRTSGSSESSNVVPDASPFTTTGTPIPTSSEGGGVGGLFLFDPFVVPGSYSAILWCSTVVMKLAGASEPASWTFLTSLPHNGEPLEQVNEIVVLCFTGVNQAIPIEGSSASVGGALTTQPPPTDTITFAQVNSLTDNDLIIAIEMTESQAPATPSGYINRHSSGLINVSSKLKATTGGEIPPSTTMAAPDTWGTSCVSVKARAQIVTGGKDTFATQDTTSASVDAVVVNLCTKVDEAGHTVGAVARQSSTDSESDGITPSTDYLIYQFPYETAPDTGVWSTAKFNGSEFGYALDAPVPPPPPPPPEEAVIFEVDAANYTGTYGDGDPITSIVETGIHGYTLSLAHVISGDWVEQTFDTSSPAVNNEPSIVGFTEPLDCLPTTRNAGYLNTGTGTASDLFLPSAFTLMCVFNLTQFQGCWQNGEPKIIDRKGNTGGDLTGWLLALGGSGDPGGTGLIYFQRVNSVGSTICVAQAVTVIAENTTYLVTVICDGATVSIRINSVEEASDTYAVGTEPIINNQLNFLQSGAGFDGGDGNDAPQGQVPFTKIWSIELQPADLASIESALITRFGI